MSGRTARHDADADVVVVGGGPVGVAVALFAAKRGVSAIVVERETEVYNLARAIGMDDEVQRIFQNHGLGDELRAITTPMRGAEFVTPEGERIIGIELPEDVAWPLGHHPTVAYHQPALEQLLRTAALEAGVRLLLGAEVQSISQRDGTVTTIVRSADGAESPLHSRWGVGADGASSGVRQSLGIAFEDLGFDQDWLVVDTRLLRDVDLPPLVQQICDAERPVTFVTGHDRYRRWEFQLQSGESREEMEHPDRVWELLAPWVAPGDADVERAVVYRFHATVAASMRSGSIFLAGDAAHQMPPFLGQGLCSGFRDAANLAWKLAAVRDGVAGDRLLDSYDAERRPHATGLVAHAVDTGRLIDQLAGRVDAGVATEAGYGGGRPFPHLEHGLITGDHPLVGRQLPQPTIDGQPLDELLGTGFALVVATPDVVSGEVREALASVGGRIVDLGGHLDALPVLPASGAIVVRPDRIIAAVCEDASVLSAAVAELRVWFS